jgi:serine phosphatase RsbU (regulator of sigma subunit)
VAEKGLAALVLDTQLDSRFKEAASLMSAGFRSLVAAPLLDPEGSLGMIVLGSRINVRQFREEDMELLTSLASVAAMRIRNVRLAEEAAERRRLEKEVKLARAIQIALLPSTLPSLESYALHAGNLPSQGVSGDFYKVLLRDEGRELVLLVADVSGKGIGASLLTGALEALSAAPIDGGAPPDEVCRQVSRLLFERTPPEKFATAFLVTLKLEDGTLTYANAGHNPGLVLRRDGTPEWLEATGLPVGVLPAVNYTASTVRLDPGDTLVLYTDGITEAMNPAEEEYGSERLLEVCDGHRGDGLVALAEAIEDDLESFADGVPFADDRTLVLLRRLAEEPDVRER